MGSELHLGSDCHRRPAGSLCLVEVTTSRRLAGRSISKLNSYPARWSFSCILAPLHWSSISNIQRTQKYSAVMYWWYRRQVVNGDLKSKFANQFFLLETSRNDIEGHRDVLSDPVYAMLPHILGLHSYGYLLGLKMGVFGVQVLNKRKRFIFSYPSDVWEVVANLRAFLALDILIVEDQF